MTVEAQGLGFAYRAEPVLRGVSLRLGPGISAVVGPNAAGKSTLLKCLCGVLRPSGEVRIEGRELRDFRGRDLARVVSYLPQDLSGRAALTVFETVLLGRAHELGWRVSGDDLRATSALLDELDIADLGDRNIGELSGGQFQMVPIAQALARQPRVLLMDEPTSSLDMEHQFAICSLIRRLTDSRGIATAMALHDLNIAARFADAVYLLDAGRVRCSGPPSEVLTEEMIRSVYRVSARVTLDGDGRPLVTPLGLARKFP